MRSARKHKRISGASIAVYMVALLLVLLAFYYIFIYSNASNRLLTLDNVNGVFGSNLYIVEAAPKCVSSSLLFNSTRVNDICTAVFIATRNVTYAPYEITAFSYSFASGSAASAYIATVVPAFNATPWPAGATAFGNVSSAGNFTLYYTTVSYKTSTPFQTVSTIYVLSGTRIFGVSTIIFPGQNLTEAHAGAADLLRIQYLRNSGAW